MRLIGMKEKIILESLHFFVLDFGGGGILLGINPELCG
jgi:hypothetical protein